MVQLAIVLGVAVVASIAIIIAGAIFVRRTFAILDGCFQRQVEQWKRQKEDGTLPEYMQDLDLDSLKPEDMGYPVASGMHRRLDLAMFMKQFWYVLIPLTVAFCLVVADIVRLILSNLG
jgi:hypothetical protein